MTIKEKTVLSIWRANKMAKIALDTQATNETLVCHWLQLAAIARERKALVKQLMAVLPEFMTKDPAVDFNNILEEVMSRGRSSRNYFLRSPAFGEELSTKKKFKIFMSLNKIWKDIIEVTAQEDPITDAVRANPHWQYTFTVTFKAVVLPPVI